MRIKGENADAEPGTISGTWLGPDNYQPPSLCTAVKALERG